MIKHGKTQKLLLAAAVIAGAMLLNATAPSSRGAHEVSRAQRSQRVYVDKSDIQRLRWVAGTWRGTDCKGMLPFFKRYHFEGDTRLVVETFSDESLRKPIGVTQFDLKNGRFARLGEGPSLEAFEVGEESTIFKVSADYEYSYHWQRKSKDLWEVVAWAEYGGKVKVRFFRMHRWKGPDAEYPCWSPPTDPPPTFAGMIKLPLYADSGKNPMVIAMGF